MASLPYLAIVSEFKIYIYLISDITSHFPISSIETSESSEFKYFQKRGRQFLIGSSNSYIHIYEITDLKNPQLVIKSNYAHI